MRLGLACLLTLASLPLAAWPADAAAPAIAERLFIDSSHAGARTAFAAFDTTKRTIFDVDGDGIPEIISQNDNGKVYVIRGSDGRVVSELATVHPHGWGARDLNDVAVGDVNGNGRIDLVVANSVGYVTAYELKREQKVADELAWERLWNRAIDPRQVWPGIEAARPGYDWTVTFPGMDGGAYLADADRDGKLEIFIQHDNQPGFFALDHAGEIRWAVNWSDGNANPWVDDLNGDGRLEAVFVSDGGGVFVFDAATGGPRATFQAKSAPGACAAYPAAISVSPGVADLDGDGTKEILFGARQANGTEADAKSADWRAGQDTRIYAVTPAGELRWCFTADWLAPHVYMHPAVVDVDGDGRRDVVFTDWNTIGHKPGSWETVDPPHVFALSADGALLWKRDLRTGWANKDVAVADVDGDGAQEILVVEEQGGREGVTLLSLSGKFERHLPVREGWSVTRGPQVADLDDDGSLDLLVPVHRGAKGCAATYDVGCREGAIEVWDTPGKAAAFAGNFLFNHEYERAYDSSSPKRPEPPEKTPAPQTGTLAGRVADDDGPIPGAKIVATGDAGEVEGETDRDGEYSMRLPAGTWRVRIEAFAHAAAESDVETRGARLTRHDAALAETPGIGALPNYVNSVPAWGLSALAAAAAAALAIRKRTQP